MSVQSTLSMRRSSALPCVWLVDFEVRCRIGVAVDDGDGASRERLSKLGEEVKELRGWRDASARRCVPHEVLGGSGLARGSDCRCLRGRG